MASGTSTRCSDTGTASSPPASTKRVLPARSHAARTVPSGAFLAMSVTRPSPIVNRIPPPPVCTSGLIPIATAITPPAHAQARPATSAIIQMPHDSRGACAAGEPCRDADGDEAVQESPP